MEPLDFGVANTHNIEDLGYDEHSYLKKDEISIKRYDEYSTLADKRKALIYDLQNDILPEDEKYNLPVFFLTWINKIPLGVIDKLSNGGFKINLNKIEHPLQRQALTKFISDGGDALSSTAMAEVQKIIKNVAKEVMLHISPKNTLAHRTLLNMFKNGKLREIINYNLKKHHYDLFGEKWANRLIMPILDEIGKIHADEKQMIAKENEIVNKSPIDILRESLRKIFNESVKI